MVTPDEVNDLYARAEGLIRGETSLAGESQAETDGDRGSGAERLSELVKSSDSFWIWLRVDVPIPVILSNLHRQ